MEKAGLTGGSLYGIHVTELDDRQQCADNNNESNATDARRRLPVGLLARQSRRRQRPDRRRARCGERGRRRDLVPAAGGRRLEHGRSRHLLLRHHQRLRCAEPAVGGGLQRRRQSGRAAAPSRCCSTAPRASRCSTTSPSPSDGKIILQEDVGNNAHIGKIWQYDPATDR